MIPIRSRSSVRRASSTLGVWLLLAAGAGGLGQCRQVEDRLTGVSIAPGRGGAGDCISRCQQAANQAMRAESELHVSRMRECRDASCRETERARHQAAVESIQTARHACVSACHHQGGGRGGDD